MRGTGEKRVNERKTGDPECRGFTLLEPILQESKSFQEVVYETRQRFQAWISARFYPRGWNLRVQHVRREKLRDLGKWDVRYFESIQFFSVYFFIVFQGEGSTFFPGM